VNLISFQSYCHVNFVKIACVKLFFCVYFPKTDNICEMLVSGKLNACALLHKESHIKTDKCH
jgi:hypothetical protein